MPYFLDTFAPNPHTQRKTQKKKKKQQPPPEKAERKNKINLFRRLAERIFIGGMIP